MHYLMTLDGSENPPFTLPATAAAGDYVAIAAVGVLAGTLAGTAVTVGDIFLYANGGNAAVAPSWQRSSISFLALPALSTFLPDYFQQVQDFTALLAGEQATLNHLNSDLLQLLANQFVQTCDVPTLGNFEAIFGILADPSTETNQFRRLRLLNRYAAQPPFSLPYLGAVLQTFFGTQWWVNFTTNPRWNYALGSWALGVQPFESDTDLELQASFPSSDMASYNEVSATIKAMLPCHIGYSNVAYPSVAPAGAMTGLSEP